MSWAFPLDLEKRALNPLGPADSGLGLRVRLPCMAL